MESLKHGITKNDTVVLTKRDYCALRDALAEAIEALKLFDTGNIVNLEYFQEVLKNTNKPI